MIEIRLNDVYGGKAVLPRPVQHTKPGWTEQVKHAHGGMWYREVSPSGRKGRWQPVDTYWANDP
jgi:hypothetical protein